MDHIVGGKFKLGRKIGSGSFGELFLGIIIIGRLILGVISIYIYTSIHVYICVHVSFVDNLLV